MKRLLSLGLVGVFAACGRGEDARTAAGDTAGMHLGMDSMPMQGMERGGMQGMGGMTAMMAGMRQHMDSMMRLPPERMKAMMADHDRMMAQMMDRMGTDMRAMNMAGDRGWNALSDSVRQDLAALPALEGAALRDRMRAHADRVVRLMGLHERMMGSMQRR